MFISSVDTIHTWIHTSPLYVLDPTSAASASTRSNSLPLSLDTDSTATSSIATFASNGATAVRIACAAGVWGGEIAPVATRPTRRFLLDFAIAFDFEGAPDLPDSNHKQNSQHSLCF